eukprot:m.7981 g.7981  ORF g.7981 m.7981 type:complete len:120 (-) comp4970_c0_seq1:49-408(-)
MMSSADFGLMNGVKADLGTNLGKALRPDQIWTQEMRDLFLHHLATGINAGLVGVTKGLHRAGFLIGLGLAAGGAFIALGLIVSTGMQLQQTEQHPTAHSRRTVGSAAAGGHEHGSRHRS